MFTTVTGVLVVNDGPTNYVDVDWTYSGTASKAKALVNELWEDRMHAAARREVTQQLALYGSQEFADLREQRRVERAAKAAGTPAA
jgi:hypothetical protein